ncbi:zinc fingers and homeoboxes protein 2 [Rhinatrema bivittatum]|uniref:zinc fingers and homeoboxes protein 2 n=1 Tax=Rhinatrema bivittatum TaxID=194408 RepID=UPI00112E7756|nr:zinc fingers and homeoboxes protein 2 [Rhinatrema bivittatum]XP_029447823.1 zinc fingers and homeoboxes protein 2 [Rhinatrema bivittatum]XP_029447824.1 zinc fingers and homeoboxes protein 2 [Rhinatrema bivittatum]
MASKRKSTTPCMVRSSEVEHGDPDEVETLKERSAGTPKQESKDDWETECSRKDCEVVEGKSAMDNTSKKVQGGYECKYCPYSTKNLNEFTEHVDLQHPNVILNPLYVCAECNFTTKKYDSLSDHNIKFHPGESNFKLKLMKRNNQTVLEQSIDRTNIVVTVGNSCLENVENDEHLSAGITVTKTPIMKMGKAKVDGKKMLRKPEEVAMENQIDGSSCIITETTKTISVNGTELLQDAMAHVMPSVQLPPNISLLPKVPVPLNSTKYNSALDVNETLINSFNKFPYPTQAELSWLTAASKHPEEQIRIWFATQRLKHGISWSPEEVEEARKKMFNGTIQPVPHTFTVLPASLASNSKVSQPIIQTAVPCQILGQTGLVLTQVANGSVTCPPFTLAVAGSSNQGQKRPLQNQPVTPETKRPQMVQSPKLSQSIATSPNDRKKTKEQIAVLKASFLASQFPDDSEVYRLIEITGLSRSDIKKWFSDHRYRSQRGIVHITSESIAKAQLAIAAARSSGRSYHPYPDFLPQKFKEKTEDQVKVLECCFAKSSFPTQMDLDRLRAETKLSRREIDLWFSERRKLRDSKEQAVLDSVEVHTKRKQGMQNGSVTQFGEMTGSHLLDCFSNSSELHKIKQEQLHLLKTIFARTQWPSPQEYDQLAAQTGLVRTEIVRWFKDNRCTLRTGSLKWMEQYQKQYNHPPEQNQSKGSIKNAGSPKNGKGAPKQYYLENKELNNANLDKRVLKSEMSYEQMRDCFSAKPRDEARDRSESNSRDGQCSDENESGDVNWVEVNVGDEDAISDGADSWNQTAQEGQTELAVFESENAPGENSHI